MTIILQAKNVETNNVWIVQADSLRPAAIALLREVPETERLEELCAALAILSFLENGEAGELRPCWKGGIWQLGWSYKP